MSTAQASTRARWSLALLVGCLLLIEGCASAPGGNPRDPWEPFNRRVSAFNENLDDAVVRPAAKAYQHVLPQLVRTGVTNFFGNISDVWSVVNNALQLKPKETAEMIVRVGVNTVFGVVGLVDLATEMKLDRYREDFGQTLGYWGVSTGPYVVLPVLGPSTLRDALALPVDARGDLVNATSDTTSRVSLHVLRGVDIRAGLFGAGNFLDNAALDRYSFIRDAYLQRRRGQIGLPDTTSEPEERYDLPEPTGAGDKPSDQPVDQQPGSVATPKAP